VSAWSGPPPQATTEGFTPPPYPYDQLQALAQLAAKSPGGLVDLSVGTPCDPPPPAVVAALSNSDAERGYPSSVGSPAFREAAARYLGRRFGVSVEPSGLAACVGTKELVASLAWHLRLRTPGFDTVLGPALAYPTYAMGATLAGCRYVGVAAGPDGVMDLDALSDDDVARALVLWVNSPANPNGALSDLGPMVQWARQHGVLLCSDECYAEYTWAGDPASVLRHGADGVLAVHSLSKRSNLAGLRAGFYAGDPELVGYLSVLRTHAGLMVPGPVQAAAVAALDDDAHVEVQRSRYHRRLVRAVEAFLAAGLDARMPAGGFYLWVPVPDWACRAGQATERDGAWVLAEALARASGILVSPGEFYGVDGRGFVRVAVVVPDERLDGALDRLASGGDTLAESSVMADTVPGTSGTAR
jgi:succinyldiaminopimelate transaminase